jgi:hypothetical protein
MDFGCSRGDNPFIQLYANPQTHVDGLGRLNYNQAMKHLSLDNQVAKSKF